MKQFTFNNEENILSYFRQSDFKVLAVPFNERIDEIYSYISDDKVWETEWINSAKKSDPPPDFYNPDRMIMMEVMSFDDKAVIGGKINATKAKEKKLLDQLRHLEIETTFPNLKNISILADSGLPLDEDHNFRRYKSNFKRVIEKHSKKIPNYKKNHREYKLIFFIFDEASGIYFESNSKNSKSIGTPILARPHLYYADDDFVKVIKSCGADFLVWFKPYNSYTTINGVRDDLPKVMIYDINEMNIKTTTYKTEMMESSEI